MKRLGLLRHAKSDWGDARARDFDRPLNARGRRGAAAMGAHIRAEALASGSRWDRIIASPAARAAETIEIAGQAAGAPPGSGFAVNWDRRIYLASAETLLDLLRACDETYRAVMLVGHNPGLEDLIFALVPDDPADPLRASVVEKFPTAALAVLELGISRWSELAPGCGRFISLTRPRDLDPELGPDFSGGACG